MQSPPNYCASDATTHSPDEEREARQRTCRRRFTRKTTNDPKTDATAAVIAPRDVEVYVDQLNAASDRLGAGLIFHDARDHEGFTEEPPFRAAYAVLRIAADEEDYLAWRTLLSLFAGIGPGTIGALYDVGPGHLVTAVRAIATTNARVRALSDLGLTARERLRATDTRDAVWTILEEVVATILPGSTTATWRERVDEAIPETEPAEAFAKLLARFQDRVHVSIADATTTPKDVLVYTTFGSKGQQWPHVFVVGAYSQGFQDSVAADGLRKLYVTLTRAMATLTITMPRWVRHTPLEQRLPTFAPTFTPDLVEAIAARGIQIEADPS